MPFFSPPVECAADGYRPAQVLICKHRSPYPEESVSQTHHRLVQELDRLIAECQEENWDGQGANPVGVQSYLAARRFIQSLPHGMPSPTVNADRDGCVTFEWYASPHKLLLISANPNYRLDYAMSVGIAKAYGTEPFFNVLPGAVVEMVQRICKI